jgi:hypothetical protein
MGAERLEEILTTLSRRGCALEETCLGLYHQVNHYKIKENRRKLIEEIEHELEYFSAALKELKNMK